jgi:2TM domain
MRSFISRSFKGHFLAYLLANAALTGVNIYMGAPWWAVWPLLIWGLLLMLHFLVHRATSVDDAWVEERTLDLRSKSYDMAHIDDIREHPAPSLKDQAAGALPPGKR